jgi:hypothetical protein
VSRLVAVVAWFVAVIGATALGLLVVGGIGAGISAPGPAPLSDDEIARVLASSPPVPPVVSPVPPAPDAAPQVINSSGGTVVARCSGGAPAVLSAVPAQGWQIHDSDEGEGGRVRFESGSGSGRGGRVELRLSCQGGRAVAEIRTG